MPSDFEREIAARIEGAIDFHVTAFTEGLKAALIGLTVEDVKGEVWDSDGRWAITLTLSDGSIIEVPGVTRAAGPLAELVRMAGGNPWGSSDEEVDALRDGWEIG